MTVHTFPESRRPTPADGRAKATGADAPVAETSAAGEETAPPLKTPTSALFLLLHAYERRWWENGVASARGMISVGFALLLSAAPRDVAIAFAKEMLASLQRPDGAA